MKRHPFYTIALLATLLIVGYSDADQHHDRPNVVLILADDLGYGDLSCYGASDLRTPAIDSIARDGMTFNNFYANSCVCSPTRAALLTGRYQDLVGVPGVVRTHAHNNWGHLLRDAILIPKPMSELGYRTGIVGKWHLGLQSPNTPIDRGFDHFHGFLGDMMDDYYNHRRHGFNYMRLNDKEIDPEGHATDLFSDWACDFIRDTSQRNAPFFLYLAYNAPHTPIQPPQDWLEKIQKREPEMSLRRAKLVALIEHMDAGIAKVLGQLKKSELLDNTLVIFTSDNGGQLNAGANNGPWRDGKQSMYEGGLRVPMIAMWPGTIHAGTTNDHVALSMDLFPTIVAAAGGTVAHPIEGESVLPQLLGKKTEPKDRALFFTRREGGNRYGGKTIEAVISGEWKLLQNSPFQPLELYNLKNDPSESIELSKKAPKKFNQLSDLLRKQIQLFGAVPWQDTTGQ